MVNPAGTAHSVTVEIGVELVALTHYAAERADRIVACLREAARRLPPNA